jgi:CheY-like chemotaxis protein
VTAVDAESALRLVRETQPDVVISDIQLPGMSGLDLVDEILQLESPPPVILISAHDEPKNHKAVAFIPKPFDPDQLLRIVQPFLDDRRNRRSLDVPVSKPSRGTDFESAPAV